MLKPKPAELRRMLVIAHDMAKCGILFVPMPVSSAEEYIARSNEMAIRLDQMDKEVETES